MQPVHSYMPLPTFGAGGSDLRVEMTAATPSVEDGPAVVEVRHASVPDATDNRMEIDRVQIVARGQIAALVSLEPQQVEMSPQPWRFAF